MPSSYLGTNSSLPHPGHLSPPRCRLEKFTQGGLHMLASSASPLTTHHLTKEGRRLRQFHPPYPSPPPSCWTCLAFEPADQACPVRSPPQNFTGFATLPSPAIRCTLAGNEKDIVKLSKISSAFNIQVVNKGDSYCSRPSSINSLNSRWLRFGKKAILLICSRVWRLATTSAILSFYANRYFFLLTD